jgi:hypothetical protein
MIAEQTQWSSIQPAYQSNERTQRLTDYALGCEFGISFLDDAIAKILPTDLVVAGAASGFGKTELGTIIAKHNCAKGKRVLYIALEADEFEIHQRIKYQEIAKLFFQDREPYKDLWLSFRDWKLGFFDVRLQKLEALADLEMLRYENITVITPQVAEFFRKDLELTWDSLSESHDMVILDHLHFLDYEEQSESLGVKRNIAKIRNLVSKSRIPCIVISHLRKQGRTNEAITPQMEELHGSSEIYKQANHVLSFTKCYGLTFDEKTVNFKEPLTAMEILKTRWAEGVSYIGLLNFDNQRKQYDELYFLLKIKNRFATQTEPVFYNRRPYWAKNMHAKDL